MLKTRIVQLLLFLITTYTALAQPQQLQLANEYFQQGELEKAKTLYDQLAENSRNIPQINSNYLVILKQIGDPREVKNYFDRVLKWFPGNISYQVDEVTYYFEIADEKTFSKKLQELKNYYQDNRYQLSQIAQQLGINRMYTQSADFFLMARALSDVEGTYSLELARVYALLNDKEKMVDEYLNYAKLGKQNTSYIKNIFQNLLSEEDDLTFLENAILNRLQKEPEETTYPDLMIWLELQRQNYYGAFVQSRALDRREATSGSNTRRVGQIAIDNQYWEDAEVIFEYLVKNYPEDNSQAYYRKMLIQAKEGKVKNTFPVDKAQIKNLSQEYKRLYEDIGPNNYTYEALKNMAHLHAFYLDQIDTAAIILQHIIDSPRAGRNLISECKLDLGDIYILKEEPWEATLLYSQVEKANRDSPLAYDAKLKNARLHYYTGNFALAKSHLDILKRATTREISNDAIDLTVLITDNTYLDSTDMVMQTYAAIELMIFQNQFERAKEALEKMITDYPNHSILDEVYWRLSELYEKEGDFNSAIDYLTKITVEYSYDILVDDAAFKIAKLTEEQLGDLQTAQQLYQEFMINHPGSSYTAEARNRFRKLRGDYGS